MLLFSTLLSVNKTMTQDAFIALAIRWNQESPHKENVIPGIQWNGERNIRYGNEQIWMEIMEFREENLIAIRYEKIAEDGVVWDTDFVMNFNQMKLSVRLDRSYLEEALPVSPAFSTPHFITLLIEGGYLDPDGDLPVHRVPILVGDTMLPQLAEVINGERHYQLPIVYVSKTMDDRNPVDVYKLAGRLKGVAHVLVQNSKWQNRMLRDLTDDQNEYDGAVGVYFPNVAVPPKRFLHYSHVDGDKILMEKVIGAVIQYANAQQLDKLYTWSGANNAMLRFRFCYQRDRKRAALAENEQTKQETLELLQGADEELAELRKKIEELTHENDVLTYENGGLRTKLSEQSKPPLLFYGNEDELYQGEIREFILDTLTASLRTMDPSTRRAHVVKDIIASNGGCTGILAEMEQAIKALFKGYKNVSVTMKQNLKNMGFEITEQGKHYKLCYYGDGRYTTIMAKTPSDNRTGANTAQKIISQIL